MLLNVFNQQPILFTELNMQFDFFLQMEDESCGLMQVKIDLAKDRDTYTAYIGHSLRFVRSQSICAGKLYLLIVSLPGC